jgi:hypothetical protein
VLIVIVHRNIPGLSPTKITPEIAGTKKAALDIILEVNKFLISVALAIIGFLGTVILGKIQYTKGRLANSLVLTSCLFSLISLYLGYELYNILITELSNSIVDFNVPEIDFLRKYEFISIIISAGLFILFINKTIKISNDEAVDTVHTMD